MKKNAIVFIKHIQESIKQIEEYVQGLSYEDFLDSKQIQDAVVRRFEIIGEAMKNIPEGFKKQHQEIAWRKISSMRDILIHEYFGVSMQIVWDTAKKDLPFLKKQIITLLKDTK